MPGLCTMGYRYLLQFAIRHLGYDVAYFDRVRLLKHFGINLILDVGANVGQYAAEMRSFGYRGRIISFEPLAQEFQSLLKRTSRDKLWTAINCALGERDDTVQMHVSRNSVSSSILEVLPHSLEAAPMSAHARSETAQMKRLDSLFHELYLNGDRVLLKLDTQGYDYQVLHGAMRSLPSILGVQIEMSMVPLYIGERQIGDLLQFLTGQGFSLMAIEPGFRNRVTGQMLSVDGIFYREP
jgi:FkbM family methyltransferase